MGQIHRLLRGDGPEVLAGVRQAEASFRRTLAEISVKHHGYARFNPFAHGAMKITVDDVLMSPLVAIPAGARRVSHERGGRLRDPLRRGHRDGAHQETARTSRSVSG